MIFRLFRKVFKKKEKERERDQERGGGRFRLFLKSYAETRYLKVIKAQWFGIQWGRVLVLLIGCEPDL